MTNIGHLSFVKRSNMDEARQRFLLGLNRIVATQQPLSAVLAALWQGLPSLLGEETAHLFIRSGGEWQCRWSSDGRCAAEDWGNWTAAVAARLAAQEQLEEWSDPEQGEQFHPIPLLNNNKRIGCWLIAAPLTADLSPEQRLFHELVAGPINAILQRHHLEMQLRQRRRQLDLLYALSDANSSLRPLEPTLADIHDQLNKSFEAAICLIALYDQESGVISFPYAVNYSERLDVTSLTVDDPDSITAWVIRNNTPYTLAHWQDKLRRPAPGILLGEMPKILVCYPMQLRDTVVGAISIQSQDLFAFNEEDEALLAAVARHAAVAIQHARLYADAQRRLRDMSALVSMAKQITGDLQLGPVMETTVHILQELFAARACTIALLTPDGDELVVEAAAGIDPHWLGAARMRVGEGVSGQAVLNREPIYVPDTDTESDFLFFNPNLRSLLAAPLINRDKALGALTIDSEQPNAFDESVIQLMMIAAAQVGVAIANARLYEESEDRAEKLKDSNRLKDELVQNVSHELRTPLTFVKGYVDLLLDGTMGIVTLEQHEALHIIADKTKEITRLVNDIMSLQRIETGNLIVESFSLRQLIEECIAGHTLTADASGLRFEFAAPTGVSADIWADRGRVSQVLNNLIVNAMKFSPNGGMVRIDLSLNGEVCEFTVSDQGVGIPSDKIELIFERFYQVDGSTRRRFGGAGLGLAIVKRIVDAHYGRIWVTSQENKGSSFYVSLPTNLQHLADAQQETTVMGKMLGRLEGNL